jgi:hypothetical protein
MSETAPKTTEQLKGLEELSRNAEHMLPTAEQAEPLRAGEKDPLQALVEARTHVEETAETSTPLKLENSLKEAENGSQPAQPSFINASLKNITLNRELKQIQRKLPAPQRILSRVIHQPAVRVTSEVIGRSASRPSGLLGGGLVALLGTSGYLYLAKHLGFTYNYLVFLLLFAAGFIIGLILELLVHVATTSRRTSN